MIIEKIDSFSYTKRMPLKKLHFFIKKVLFPSLIFLFSFNIYSISFTGGFEINNIYLKIDNPTLTSDAGFIFESEPLKIPLLFGAGISQRFVQKHTSLNSCYFNQNYESFYFNKGFLFYSGYSFYHQLNQPFFIQFQPSLFYKYSTNEFYKKVPSLNGSTRLTLESIHQLGVFLPVEIGLQIKKISLMFKFTAIYIPFYYVNDDYYLPYNSQYVKVGNDSNSNFNSFGYSFGFFVKYTL